MPQEQLKLDYEKAVGINRKLWEIIADIQQNKKTQTVDLSTAFPDINTPEKLAEVLRAVVDAMLERNKGDMPVGNHVSNSFIALRPTMRPAQNREIQIGPDIAIPLTLDDPEDTGRIVGFADHMPHAMWAHDASLWVFEKRSLAAMVFRTHLPPDNKDLFYNPDRENCMEEDNGT